LEVECWNGRFFVVVRITPAKKIELFGLKKIYVFGEQSQEEEMLQKTQKFVESPKPTCQS
jgi:hypothetical protein